MLRPNQVSDKTFESAGDGKYLAAEVDAFLSEVSSSYEQVFRENGELIRKISLLANKVEAYRREEEKAEKMPQNNVDETVEEKVQQARDAAQQMLVNAKQQAESIVSKANEDAKGILVDLTNKVKEQKLVLEMLNKESENFKNSLIDAYREHLKMVDSLPAVAQQEVEVQPAEEIEDFTVLDVEEPEEIAEEPEQEPVFEEAEVSEPEVIEEPVVEIDEPEETEPAFTPVIEDSEPEGIEDIKEVEEITVSEPVEEKAEEIAVDYSSESVEDDETDEEVTEEAPKGFSFDFSSISFDDDDEEPVSEYKSDKGIFNVSIEDEEEISDADETEIEEDDGDDDDDDGTISFKDFFNKK